LRGETDATICERAGPDPAACRPDRQFLSPRGTCITAWRVTAYAVRCVLWPKRPCHVVPAAQPSEPWWKGLRITAAMHEQLVHERRVRRSPRCHAQRGYPQCGDTHRGRNSLASQMHIFTVSLAPGRTYPAARDHGAAHATYKAPVVVPWPGRRRLRARKLANLQFGQMAGKDLLRQKQTEHEQPRSKNRTTAATLTVPADSYLAPLRWCTSSGPWCRSRCRLRRGWLSSASLRKVATLVGKRTPPTFVNALTQVRGHGRVVIIC
jgi:hypothetical protein